MFLREGERLRKLRQHLGENGPSVVAFSRHRILDLAKLRQSMLAQRLLRDEALNGCFVSLLNRQDSEGAIGRSFSFLMKSFPEPNQEAIREKLWWLRDFGFLAKTKTGMRITERGIEVAYLAMGQSIVRLAQDTLSAYRQDAAPLAELVNVTHVSPSLLLRALRELENGWLRCFSINGQRCELFWLPRPNREEKVAMRKLRALQSRVLNVLGQVHYPLATAKIHDELRAEGMMHFVLTLLLSGMKSQNILTEPEGGMWFYPWEKRIIDILSGEAHPVLATDELMKAVGFPYVEKDHLLQILRRLEAERVIGELEEEKWALESSDEATVRDQLRSLVRAECKDHMLDVVTSQGGWMRSDRLLSETRLFLRKRMERFGKHDELESQLFESCLKDLQRDGRLVVAGDIVRSARRESI